MWQQRTARRRPCSRACRGFWEQTWGSRSRGSQGTPGSGAKGGLHKREALSPSWGGILLTQIQPAGKEIDSGTAEEQKMSLFSLCLTACALLLWRSERPHTGSSHHNFPFPIPIGFIARPEVKESQLTVKIGEFDFLSPDFREVMCSSKLINPQPQSGSI